MSSKSEPLQQKRNVQMQLMKNLLLAIEVKMKKRLCVVCV